jgi:cytochrome c oxidase assembly protein subunit 15
MNMFFRKEIEHKKLFKLALASFIFTIFVIILGVFTRLADAGLGCPDWPGCYGHLLWPNEAHEIVKAEAKFPDAPVEHDKTWPEMVHRYLAGSLGLFILAIAIISLTQRKAQLASEALNSPASAASKSALSRSLASSIVDIGQRVPIKLPLILLAMVILQATFGALTVTLKLWPKIVTTHLLGGFTTLTLLWILTQRLGGSRWLLNESQKNTLQTIKPWLIMGLIAVISQIALGGWVSSNYAALACPDLPKCLNQWIPPTDFKAGFNIWQDIGPNYLGGQLDNHARTAIHLTHRIGAIVVLVILVIMGVKLLRVKAKEVSQWVYLLWAVLCIQILLGMSNIIYSLPLSIAVAHAVVGAGLLITLISIIYRTYDVNFAADENMGK